MVFLTRFEAENFGCFPKLRLELSPLTVFVGPNDSGKTTILKAIQSLALLSGGDQEGEGCPVALSQALPMPRLKWAAAKADQTVRLKASGATTVGAYVINTSLQPRGDRPGKEWIESQTVGWENFGVQASNGKIALPTAWAEHVDLTPFDGGILNGAFEARRPNLSGAAEFLELRRDIKHIQLFRLDPDVLRMTSPAPDSDQVPQLGSHGEGLATLLSVLANAYTARRQAIERSFASAVTSLAGFQVRGGQTTDRKPGWRLKFVLKGGKGEIEADQASDGALMFLAFLALLEHPRPPKVILIEEPENGVHPSRLREIVKLLRKLTIATDDRPAAQIVMTTHSPYLLDEVRPEEAYFCVRDEDGAARALPFAQIDKLDERLADYKLGELWTALGEQKLEQLVKAS